MTRLLIVDDSALMRRQLTALFEAAGGFEIRTARNGVEALAENLRFEPDVITLDINMPEMDGLSALARIMCERAAPVVMLSSLTEQGALATFEALNMGAVDYIPKPGGTISRSLEAIEKALVDKVRGAARARPKAAAAAASHPAPPAPQPAAPRPARPAGGDGVVLIGVSTGGPRTLEAILPALPRDLPWPVLVAQHMPAQFTLPFAQRLDGLCALEVVEASRPMPLEPGRIYIGKGGADMVVVERGGQRMVTARPESAQHLWHPSVELLARSLLEHVDPASLVGVMLTGMGSDGADGMAEIRRRGGRTIAESEASAVVFGMPAELIRRGGASVVLHADRVAAQIIDWLA